MKNSILAVLFFLLATISTAQYKYTVSAGGNHERLHEAYGNHIRMYYNFNENFKLNTEFARYYEVTEKTQDEAIGYDVRSLDLNINYAILFGDHLGIYAILGISTTYGRRVTKNATDTTEKFIENGGLNVGFGAFYTIGRFMPYVETRNMTGNPNYLIFSAGLAYSFGKRDDDE